MAYLKIAMNPALRTPEAGRVTTHAIKILRNRDQSTFACDRTRPTNTMEPTLQWVVEMGMPILDAMSTVKADPTSMQNPLEDKENKRKKIVVFIAINKHSKTAHRKWIKIAKYFALHKISGRWNGIKQKSKLKLSSVSTINFAKKTIHTHMHQIACSQKFCTYVDGVILDRSSPMVLITRRPQIHSPNEMPTPPYTKIQIGMGAFWDTFCSWAITHTPTKGPIALLQKNSK